MSSDKEENFEWNGLPASDLQQLKREVLSLLPENALPANLPDRWLNMLARDLNKTVIGKGGLVGGSCCYAAAPLALILHYLLSNKPPGQGIKISLDRLYGYYCNLQAAFNVEMAHRKTGLKVERVTLDTIFTDRAVRLVALPGRKCAH